ncbi:basic helix-loop-helix (bHLH) DNA-binding superfamily protein [Actinidia rufa]|uniref:Basic helix-loop-helix (BHLH) DNA-binding superfamily protein n=1 Tax=Actinidia rufa TaxID=165716 RepID=A0A7J0EXP7_9ERIC|nr:basic helix-loop-helix (bHLH) DNA-binding superfamily protein [Actinidia rufa]
MDEPLFPSDIMESFEEELAAALGEDYQQHYSFSSESNSSNFPNLIPTSSSTTNLLASSPTELAQQEGAERPTKHHKPNNTYNSWSSTPPTPTVPSIDHQAAPSGSSTRTRLGTVRRELPKVLLLAKGQKKTSAPRPASQTYDHIIAERKRREQLSQLFVALSGIVPGLKKMDKTSVLGEAVKYLKQLQERVKTLEEQSTKQTMESVVLVKKSQLLLEDEAGSSDDNFVGGASKPLPEIEARVCNKSVLLRIHCEKHKGVLVKILSEMENLNLSVINTSVVRFGTLALDITIIAECMVVSGGGANDTCSPLGTHSLSSKALDELVH